MTADGTDARAAKRLAGLFGGLSAGLAAVCAVLLARGPAVGPGADEVREELLERMVAQTQGALDAHPDPDVSYVLLPRVEREGLRGESIRSNSFGMREREYRLPKPDGSLRVVVLGDSYVFGWGVEADERCGARLEGWLRERAPGFTGEIECLQLGITSWNVRSECAWLRRQLDRLAPDLVVHVVVPNDLDDCVGIRGFGSFGGFTPARRDWADTRLWSGTPTQFGLSGTNLFNVGLDWESRERLRDAGDRIERLAADVEARGGRYLLVSHWAELNPVVQRNWASRLRAEQVCFLPRSPFVDAENVLGDGDIHWNAAGNELVAEVLYALIRTRELLPQLDLPPWPELEERVRGWTERGAEQAAGPVPLIDRAGALLTELDFETVEKLEAIQVHGGIDAQGRVSPYASLMLRRGGGARLAVAGRCLDANSLANARVEVFADELALGVIELLPGQPIAETFPIPDALAEREQLSVRFRSSDYTFVDAGLRHCVVFRLDRVAIQP